MREKRCTISEHYCFKRNTNMDKESISFCSSCKSILQYSSSIGELYTPDEKNNIERSIENYEVGLNISEKQNKKREAGEDFCEKLMFYTNKKIKHLAPDDKNITRITCAECGNTDFNNETYPAKIPHAQDIQQRNNCKTEKTNNSIRDEEENAEMINNEFQSIDPNILNFRKNMVKIAGSVLQLSNQIEIMRELILQETKKRQSGV